MRVSATAWFEYRQKLHQINAKAEQAMSDFMDKNWPADSQAMIDYAYALTQRYGSAAAELACQMYDKTAIASKAYIKPAEPAELASYDDVSKLVYGTLKSPKETPRGVNRLVKRAAADTTLKNAKRDKVEWAWIPYGDTCAFCLTLASRGWQRASKAVMKGNHAQHIHANCDCNFQVRFSENDTVEGYDPDKYLEMYENAEGKTTEEKINSLRKTLASGALDSESRQALKHANMFYRELSNSDRPILVSKMAKSSKLDKKLVDQALNHVLNSKYDLMVNDQIKHTNFAPDYDMAQSFQRVRDGKPEKHDIIMLQHEALEAEYMDKHHLDYVDGHLKANQKYNYQRALYKWKEKK